MTAKGEGGSEQTGGVCRFTMVLGDPGSLMTIKAWCTAFRTMDERGLMFRGNRTPTHVANAGMGKNWIGGDTCILRDSESMYHPNGDK